MKQYFTLVQAFTPNHRSLAEYFETQNIEYQLGADLYEELKVFGYHDPNAKTGDLLKTYRVLLDEHELSAIKLSVDGVSNIQNRSGVKLQNKVRSYFSWFLD
jgi:hypothetical protein